MIKEVESVIGFVATCTKQKYATVGDLIRQLHAMKVIIIKRIGKGRNWKNFESISVI